MARFLKHTACPVCGSSDALAHYEDGSTYCFSHGRSTKQATISPYATLSREQAKEVESSVVVKLPEDATQDYPVQALAWTEKYGISVELLLRNKVYYSGARNQLIFSFVDGEGKVLAYQARNLSPLSKAKRYFTQGDVNGILPIYYNRVTDKHSLSLPNGSQHIPDTEYPKRTRYLVLVEDCLSAIKVASLIADSTSEKPLGFDSMPCLGSSIPLRKLTQLRAFYDQITIFLDGDMYHHALRLERQAQMIGFKTKVIYSPLDPKEHRREELTKLLQ